MKTTMKRKAPHQIAPAGFADAAIEALKNNLPAEWEAAAPAPENIPLDGEMTEEDLLYQTLAEAGVEGDQGFVSIFRIHEDSKRRDWLDRKDIIEFQSLGVPYLAKRFGAGEYELCIYTANKKIFKRPHVFVGKEAVPITANSGNDLHRVMEIMDQRFNRLMETFARPQPVAVPVQSRAEMLNEMIALKNLFGGDRGGGDQMGQLKNMLGLVKEILPRPEGAETTGMDLLMKLADSFAPAIVTAMENMPPAVAAASQTAHLPGHAALIPGQQLTPEQIGAQQMNLKIKAQLLYLCSEAKSDADPAPYAEIIVNKIPREVLDKFVASESWLTELSQFHADVLNHEAWFSELREEVAEILSNPDNLTESEDTSIAAETVDAAKNVPG